MLKTFSDAYKRAKERYNRWPQWKRDAAEQWMRPMKESDPSYLYAVDGDVYLNPSFGDLWVVQDQAFIRINDGLTIDLDEPEGFIKVGHVDGVVFEKLDSISEE